MAKKKSAKPQFDALEAEYRALAPRALRFADEVVHQLEHLLFDREIALAIPIQRRVKEWESISEKIGRKALLVKKLDSLTDLVGLRAILQFRRDISEVCDAIENSFSVIDKYDTAERLKEDQFGYSSIHFIVAFPESWLTVPALRVRAKINYRNVNRPRGWIS